MNSYRILSNTDNSSSLITSNPFFICVNLLSVISCSILFYRGFQAEKPMKMPLTLVLLLTLADFFGCIFNLLPQFIHVDDLDCQIIGFGRSISIWTGLFFGSLISLFLLSHP